MGAILEETNQEKTMCKFGTDRFVRLCTPKPYNDLVKISVNSVKVDACLAPLVQMLNDYDIETIACCCGHGKAEFSHIRLHPKNIEFLITNDALTVHLKFPYKKGKEKEGQNAS